MSHVSTAKWGLSAHLNGALADLSVGSWLARIPGGKGRELSQQLPAGNSTALVLVQVGMMRGNVTITSLSDSMSRHICTSSNKANNFLKMCQTFLGLRLQNAQLRPIATQLHYEIP